MKGLYDRSRCIPTTKTIPCLEIEVIKTVCAKVENLNTR